MQPTQQQTYASPIQRLSAVLIDTAIVTVLGLGLSAMIDDPAIKQPFTYALLLAMVACYHIGFLSAARGATPGKMIMGIYVGYPDGSGIRPDSAILRYLVLLLGNLFIIGLVISFVLLISDPQRRTVHDRVAGTRVLQGKPPGR